MRPPIAKSIPTRTWPANRWSYSRSASAISPRPTSKRPPAAHRLVLQAGRLPRLSAVPRRRREKDPRPQGPLSRRRFRRAAAGAAGHFGAAGPAAVRTFLGEGPSASPAERAKHRASWRISRPVARASTRYRLGRRADFAVAGVFCADNLRSACRRPPEFTSARSACSNISIRRRARCSWPSGSVAWGRTCSIRRTSSAGRADERGSARGRSPRGSISPRPSSMAACIIRPRRATSARWSSSGRPPRRGNRGSGSCHISCWGAIQPGLQKACTRSRERRRILRPRARRMRPPVCWLPRRGSWVTESDVSGSGSAGSTRRLVMKTKVSLVS